MTGRKHDGKNMDKVLFDLLADWKKKYEEAEGDEYSVVYTTRTMTTETADIKIA